MSTFMAVLLGVFIGAIGTILLWRLWRWWVCRDHDHYVDPGQQHVINDGPIEKFEPKPKWVIIPTDWGPDFTGEGDVLHRWRWIAMPEREAIPRMLGNSPTRDRAVMDATRWICNHVGVGEAVIEVVEQEPK